MSGTGSSGVRLGAIAQSPSELAAYLDVWALRREKVLEIIDIAAARRARAFVARCRRLAAVDEETRDEAWHAAWHVLKLDVAAFLSENTGARTPRANKAG